MRCGNTIESLIDALYSDVKRINTAANNDIYFLERSILSARNESVDQSVLNSFPGEEYIGYGSDTVQLEGGADKDGFQYPTEFLNTINVSEMPLSKLHLKKGVPLMVLRNMDPANGICNGT
jgi:hypothetical protein